MSWRTLVGHAARNLRRRPLRNVLATFGILLGTATLVALLGISRGLQLQVLDRSAEQPLLTLVQVLPGAAPAGGTARRLDDGAVDAIAHAQYVRAAFPVIVVPATLHLGDRAPGGTVLGMSPPGRAPYPLAAGRAPTADDQHAAVLTPAGIRALSLEADSAIGRSLDLELRRGDTRSERRTVTLRVVGVVADELPGQLVLISIGDAEDAVSWIATGESADARDLRLAQQAAAALLFGGRAVASDLAGSRYTGVWALADSPAHLRDVTNEMNALGFSAYSAGALSQTVDDVFRAVNAGLAAIAAVALLVAMLGVVNALVTSVSERTVEIGVLKALGANDGTVERMFLVEAALLGAIGGATGVVVGAAFALLGAALGRQAVGGAARLDPLIDAPLIAGAFAVALFVALVGGWLPARRAARLVPADALRSE